MPPVTRLERSKWLIELCREMKSWADLQQFGTMLEAVKTAAREHGLVYEELLHVVARVAIREGIVSPLPMFSSVEEMQAATGEASGSPLPLIPPGQSMD